MNVMLREGNEGDIDDLMQVMVNAFDPMFGEAWNAGQCLGILSLPDVWLTFAEEDGRAVGFALSAMAFRVVRDSAFQWQQGGEGSHVATIHP